MAENKLSLVEGAYIRTPLMFSGINYQFWKVHMKPLINSIDKGISNTNVNDPFILKHDVHNK